MPFLHLTSGPGFEFSAEYTANGRVSQMHCVNNTGRRVWGLVVLTDGQTASSTFAAGTSKMPVPGNLVRVEEQVRDGETLTVLVGVAHVAAGIIYGT